MSLLSPGWVRASSWRSGLKTREGIVPQLSEVRRKSLAALDRNVDELERRADEFVAQWRERESERRSWTDLSRAADNWLAAPEVHDAERSAAWRGYGGNGLVPSRGVREGDRALGQSGRGLGWRSASGLLPANGWPHQVDAGAGRFISEQSRRSSSTEFVAWCEERGEDPEHARAHYSADRYRTGHGVDWPPGRNDACWCGSGRKYKKCCGPAPARPMHDPER